MSICWDIFNFNFFFIHKNAVLGKSVCLIYAYFSKIISPKIFYLHVYICDLLI